MARLIVEMRDRSNERGLHVQRGEVVTILPDAHDVTRNRITWAMIQAFGPSTHAQD